MGVNCEEIISKRKYMDWGLIRFIFVVLSNFFMGKMLLMPKKKGGFIRILKRCQK